MATTKVTTSGRPRVVRHRDGHPISYVQTAGGRRVYMSWAPTDVTDTGGNDQYTTIPIIGGKPNVRRTGDGLRVLSFPFTIGTIDGSNIENRLQRWRDVAAAGSKIFVGGMGPSMHGWWYITSQTVTSNRRNHGSNWVSLATIDVELTEANDVRPKIGATSTKAKAPKSKPKGSKSKSKTNTQWRTYTVRAGDSLFKVAVHYYGDGRRWKLIATANKLKSSTIRVGQKLRIPPA